MASETFGDWLQERMDLLKISQSELAAAAGMTHAAISNYRRRGGIPTPESAAKLAKPLRVSREEIYRRAGFPVESNAMGELGADYQYREIDPRVIALARVLDDRMLNLWVEMGEVMARTDKAP